MFAAHTHELTDEDMGSGVEGLLNSVVAEGGVGIASRSAAGAGVTASEDERDLDVA